MQNTKQTLENIKANGYDIDFGSVFNNAFENYKKIALNAGVAFLLFMILMAIVVVGLFIAIFGIGTSSDAISQFNIANFSWVGILIYSVSMILFAALSSPFSAGILKMARNASRNEEVSVGNAFEYYSSSYFKEIFFATLLLSTFTTILTVGLELVDYKILGLILSMIVSFMTFITIPLIVFGELKAKDAIKGSIVIVSKQFFIVLGLLIVAFLFCMLGLFGFCIGIIFTMPFISSMTYSIYASIINDEENEENDEENHQDFETIME